MLVAYLVSAVMATARFFEPNSVGYGEPSFPAATVQDGCSHCFDGFNWTYGYDFHAHNWCPPHQSPDQITCSYAGHVGSQGHCGGQGYPAYRFDLHYWCQYTAADIQRMREAVERTLKRKTLDAADFDLILMLLPAGRGRIDGAASRTVSLIGCDGRALWRIKTPAPALRTV